MVSAIGAVVLKEIVVEFRNRSLLYTLLLFTVVVVLILAFALMEKTIAPELFVAFCWIVLFFLAIQSGARSFAAEYERETVVLLHTLVSGYAVFWGKVVYQVGMVTFLMSIAAALLLLVFDVPIASMTGFWLTLGVSSVLMGAMVPIFSALIARSQMKGALLPVLAFPVFVPLMRLGIEGMLDAVLKQWHVQTLILMGAYAGIVITLAAMLFDYVWRE